MSTKQIEENLREKKAMFKITVNEISIPEPLKDDQELASKMGAKTVHRVNKRIIGKTNFLSLKW